MMGKIFNRDKEYIKEGASEKPLGRQIPMNEQKASRKFPMNEQKPSSIKPETNPHP